MWLIASFQIISIKITNYLKNARSWLELKGFIESERGIKLSKVEQQKLKYYSKWIRGMI